MPLAKKKTKTQQAFDELAMIFGEISADGMINADEFKRIMHWRDRWRTVVRRQELRPFDVWLTEATSDGKIDSKEKLELLEWAQKIAEKYTESRKSDEGLKFGAIGDFKSGDDYLEFPKQHRPSWGSDPATAKQIGFLLDLGESEGACRGLTKGRASERIDELLAQRGSRRSAGGCGSLIVALISIGLMAICVMWLAR